jgi:hypothetical protein
MIPQGMPKMHNSNIYWGFHLVIKGAYCGFAIGEQSYFNNGRMTYGEACEGAKSNALTRLCKNIGIGVQLWEKDFTNDWLDKYADKTWDGNANEGRGKSVWKLKPNAFGAPNKDTSSNLDTKTTAPAAPTNTEIPVVNPVVTAPVVKTPVVPVIPVTPAVTAKTTPVVTKTTPKETVKETVKTTVTAKTTAKPGYTGKASNSSKRLTENKDFLNEAKEGAPVVDEDVDFDFFATTEDLVNPSLTTTEEKLVYFLATKEDRDHINEGLNPKNKNKNKWSVDQYNNEIMILSDKYYKYFKNLPANVVAFQKSVYGCKTSGALKMAYEKVKTAFEANPPEISEEHKETIRIYANALFVKLSSQGK